MKKIILSLGLWLVLLLSPQDAEAQTSQRNPCFYATSTSTGCTSVSGTNPLPVTATATIGGGFTDLTTGTPISVTTGGVTGTLPAGSVVAAFNVGTTNGAYCKLGASATTSDIYLAPNGGWFAFSVGAATQLTCITSTSTTTVNMVGGSGLPTGSGGGSGGSGGGAVTMASGAVASGAYSSGSIASGAMVDLGAQADAACGTATGTCSLIALQKYNNSVSPVLGAGSALIGDVNLRQGGNALSTTNGAYFNQLQGNAVLSATNPSFTRLTDGTNTQVTDPCNAVTKLYKAFSQTATAVLVSGTSSKKTYVCSIVIIAGAAEIFNLTAGTGSTCGTNTVAVIGSTTAANGLSLAANGGLTLGNGASALAATTVNADDLCLQQSGSNRLSGGITYVQL